ncbi:MAG: alpha-E domain-containing protein [Clostridiales bacterium]|jgi:uncharacterized alpha-E superfamily protein|nr:alpha-E domain-containing protein [Clostridiales bacterium]MDR2751843.1 alpha-E domain-containing protein [Clostridiales bacterium]
MGAVLSKANRLYWLGRYNERVYTSLQYMTRIFDQAIDGPSISYTDICSRLSIPCIYKSTEDFLRRFTFDLSNPDSIAQTADRMLGNGMVLRETISSNTLSYLQMAVNALTLASQSASPLVGMQWVLDDIMAFRGGFDDYIEDETLSNILKCGVSVERVSMYLRLNINQYDSEKELKKLLNSLYKSKLPVDPECQTLIYEKVLNGASPSHQLLLHSVESLFVI